jgi:ABC-type uncharacterized transport system permease subunit
MMDSLSPLLASALSAAVPLLLASTGELVTERAGVLNLGLEGMMLLGALSSFVTVSLGGGVVLGVAVGMLSGVMAAWIFGIMTISLQANQVAAGLSLTILGTGLTSALGRPFAGSSVDSGLAPAPIPFLRDVPVLGDSLFSLNVLAYVALVLISAIGWGLYRSRLGLQIKAVGESPAVARSLGLAVNRIRYGAVLFGGAMSGLAGSYYALAQFKMWQDNLTSGNGWIALALVVFSTWRVLRLAAGALLFGGVTALGLYFQAVNVKVSLFALASLPYVATILVLVVLSFNPAQIRRHAPAWLGKPYFDAA